MPIESITTSPATPSSDMISSRSANMDQADFLLMLTQQLKSQDPLNPLDGQDFASQLATFTSLQELQKMNSTLNSTLDADLLLSQTFNNTMAATLIGKVVRAEANSIQMGATGTGTMTYDLADAATDISIEIRDSNGDVVRTLSVNAQTAGEHAAIWDGLDSEGKHVAAGSYSFNVVAKDANGNSVNATTYIEGLVSGVRYSDGNPVLIVGDREILLGQVLSISDSELAKKG